MCVWSHKTHQEDFRACTLICKSASIKVPPHLIEALQAQRSASALHLNWRVCSFYYRDMATVSPSTAGPAMARDSEISRLGGIGALNMKVGPVRRNLFGPVDHNHLQQDFERLLRMSVEVANKRWNFDFQREKPGSGSSVEWEELRCQDVPAFYRSCMVRSAALPLSKRRTSSSSLSSSSPSSSSGESSPGSSSPSGTSDEYLDVARRGGYRVRWQGKRRQAAITGESVKSVSSQHRSARRGTTCLELTFLPYLFVFQNSSGWRRGSFCITKDLLGSRRAHLTVLILPLLTCPGYLHICTLYLVYL